MRQIKFRGFGAGRWRYGYYVHFDRHPASPETAGAQAIDWEQRRYDIVKGILVRFITHGDCEVRNEWYRMKTQYIRDAIEDADTIVEELRKTEQHGEH